MVKIKVEMIVEYPGKEDEPEGSCVANTAVHLNAALMTYFHTSIRKAIIDKMDKGHIRWLEEYLSRFTRALDSASFTKMKK